MCFRMMAWMPAALALGMAFAATALAQEEIPPPAKPAVMFKVQNANQRLEMIVRTSRILTTERKISQSQVNNPDLLDLTPISPNQVQVSAKATGITQVNLWDENRELHSIDVIVFGDARELEMVLQTTFPSAALKVRPIANAVLISGYVDKPEHVDRIVRIAEEYYPKVINNMTVSGCQQVLLNIKVMEVSRTKLRQLGFDWAKITGSNVLTSGPAGMISDFNPGSITSIGGMPPSVTDGQMNFTPVGKAALRTGTPSTFAFNVVSGTSGFFGVLNALRTDNLMSIMSEPQLVSINGEKASFNSGGEIPVPEPQSLGTISISWKKYGTQMKFVPLVLGNGRIRLDVHPEISELDDSRSFVIQGTKVPAIKMRDVHTSVEMEAGQTLAIAGLVQTRVEAFNSGLPLVADVPYLGAAFRNVNHYRNEVELLVLVKPELVEAMDEDEVPQCGPGQNSAEPNDWQLYMKGQLEVPKCCPAEPCNQNGCRQCNGPADKLPPEGMIQGPSEQIPAPVPSNAAVRPLRNGPAYGNPTDRYGRHNPPKPSSKPQSSSATASKAPPGMLGPVGYDVLK